MSRFRFQARRRCGKPAKAVAVSAAACLQGEAGAVRRAESPFNRVASPAEVADAVVYLASRQAQWASGSILDFNGASHLRM